MRNRVVMSAYQGGFSAFATGDAGVNDNPYNDTMTNRAEQWDEGYADAADQYAAYLDTREYAYD